MLCLTRDVPLPSRLTSLIVTDLGVHTALACTLSNGFPPRPCNLLSPGPLKRDAAGSASGLCRLIGRVCTNMRTDYATCYYSTRFSVRLHNILSLDGSATATKARPSMAF